MTPLGTFSEDVIIDVLSKIIVIEFILKYLKRDGESGSPQVQRQQMNGHCIEP